MADTFMYAQGQVATFWANFITTPAGTPTVTPDASIQILGPMAAVILPPTPMLPAGPTGLYYFDWTVPNSLAPNIYTVMISGTIQGMLSQMIEYVQVVPAGTPTGVSPSQTAVELVAALSTGYLDCAQHIAVYSEIPRRSADLMTYYLQWPRWNLSNPDVRLNNEQVVDGYTIDYDAGVLKFDTPRHRSDVVRVTYNFQWFSQTQLLRYLTDAISEINYYPPGSGYTLDTFPEALVGLVMMGAVKNAMKEMIFCLSFQDPSTVFGDPNRAKAAMDNFRYLKENNEKSFTAGIIALKKRLPRMAIISTPEYTMPGGRSRWFRYMFSSGAG